MRKFPKRESARGLDNDISLPVFIYRARSDFSRSEAERAILPRPTSSGVERVSEGGGGLSVCVWLGRRASRRRSARAAVRRLARGWFVRWLVGASGRLALPRCVPLRVIHRVCFRVCVRVFVSWLVLG